MYSLQINLLEILIENWFEIKTESDLKNLVGDLNPNVDLGCALCVNALLEDLDKNFVNKMFEDWYFFSGNLEFPVELNFENYSNLSNFLNTPLRLHLAVHCLRYLRFKSKG